MEVVLIYNCVDILYFYFICLKCYNIISCLPSSHSIEDRILFILKVNVVRGRYDLWDPECVKGVPQKSFRNIEDIGEEEDISWFCRTARLKYKNYGKDYHTIYEYLYGQIEYRYMQWNINT